MTMSMLERLAASKALALLHTPRWRLIKRHKAKKELREAYSNYAQSLGYIPGAWASVGWGPFKLPHEEYRMQRAYIEAKKTMDWLKELR